MIAPVLVAQTPRRPRGVYAVVNVEDAISQNPSLTPAQLDTYFNGFYQGLLADPAISGLALQVHWDTLNPNAAPAANAYFWNYVDDAFAQASSAKKTIQLIVDPGFQSPQWMLDQIPACDGLFQSPSTTPPNNCGTVTFTGYKEGGDGTELPLPWNPLYKSAWKTFLTALAGRYGQNPAFVSIAVAGPTAASAEMTTVSNSTATSQTQFGGISPNSMWSQLLGFHYAGMAAYQNSDQAFIDEWNNAIDLYGQIFRGITLVATTGGVLPKFEYELHATARTVHREVCPSPEMRCAAVATILSYFAGSSVGGANAKATQTSGMQAARAITPGNLGVAGVQWLSQYTAQFTTPSTQILGGSQFNTSFSNSPVGEGCLATFPPDSSDMPAGCTLPPNCNGPACVPIACIPQACLAPGVTPASLAGYSKFSQVPAADLIPPEQAEYNVLNIYFNGTPVATSFGGTQGITPLNYLQIYSEDIQYAQMNADAPAQVVETGGTVSTTAQDLLNLASQKLLEIAEPPEFFIGEVSLGGGVYYLQFPSGSVFGYYNFPSFPILYHYDMGFESFIDALDGNAGAYLYDFAGGHWFYTSPSLFPYLYDFTLNAWLYYFPNTKEPGHYTTNPRYFSNLTTGKIITM